MRKIPWKSSDKWLIYVDFQYHFLPNGVQMVVSEVFHLKKHLQSFEFGAFGFADPLAAGDPSAAKTLT